MGLLLNEAESLVTKDMEKAEVADASFDSVFTVNSDLQESQAPESQRLQEGRLTLSRGGSG